MAQATNAPWHVPTKVSAALYAAKPGSVVSLSNSNPASSILAPYPHLAV
jgi:hypothetical protein